MLGKANDKARRQLEVPSGGERGVGGGGAFLKYLSRCGTTVGRVQAMWMLAALMVITVEISRMREGTSYIELQSGQRISEFNNRRLFFRKLCFQSGRYNAIQ